CGRTASRRSGSRSASFDSRASSPNSCLYHSSWALIRKRAVADAEATADIARCDSMGFNMNERATGPLIPSIRTFSCGSPPSSVRRRHPSAPLRFVGVDPGFRHFLDALVLEVHLPGEKAQFLGVDREVLGDLVGDRPDVLHFAPPVLPDFA